MMRYAATTTMEILGVALVLVGIWQVFPPLALVVAGATLVAVGIRNA
jgi:hypothetical protein